MRAFSIIVVDVPTQAVGARREALPEPDSDTEMGSAGHVNAVRRAPTREVRGSNFFRSLLGSQGNDNGGAVRQRLKPQILQLMANLFPESQEAEEPELEMIGAGSYNLVFGIHMPVPQPPRVDSAILTATASLSNFFGLAPKPKDYALRLPIDNEGQLAQNDISHDVATLMVVGKHLSVTVPKIVSYDLESKNIMGRPYMLQDRICGECLERIWRTLNLAQKIDSTKKMTKLVEKIARVTTPGAGVISTNVIDFPSSNIQVQQFPVPSGSEIRRRNESVQERRFNPPEPASAPNQTVFEFLLDHIQRWSNHDQSILEYHETNQLWGALKTIVYSLERRNWLGDRFHLAHGDLFPRNIMAAVKSDKEIEITGIIDWDMACFAPKFVALRAPFWAWNDAGDWEEDNVLVAPDNPDCEALKAAFDEAASEEYWTSAFSAECIVARKVFSVMTSGLLTKKHCNLARDAIIQWNEMYPDDGLERFNVFYAPR